MLSLQIRNETRGTILVPKARVADTFWLRLKCLMFTSSLPDGEALVLSPCSSVHMFFMQYALDLVFVDRKWKVVACVNNLKPWRLTRPYWSAHTCVELNPGAIEDSGTQVGDSLRPDPPL